MLNTFARRLAARPLERHLFFLAVTAAAILVIGYHFGTFDQFAHIPYLKKYANPALYPNDSFIEMRFESFSYFWRAFVPLVQLDPLDTRLLQWALLAGHVLVTYATFWVLWAVSLELFHSPLAALLSSLAFFMPHLGFAGFPVFEFSLLNRTFALPVALAAVLLYLRGRRVWAFAVLGLLFNIHIITVNFVLAMFGLDALLRWRAGGWRWLALGGPVFLLGAAPVLIWRLTSPALTAPVNPAWFDAVSRGFLMNLFALVAPYLHINLITLAGLGTLGLYWVGRRSAPAPEHEGTVAHFIWAVIVILLVQAVTVLVYPIDLLNQLQIIRAGAFALVFGYLYFGHYLARRWEAEPGAAGDLGWLTASYIFSPMPLAPLAVLGVQRGLAAFRWRSVVAAATFLGAFALTLAVAVPLGLWAPGLHPFGPQTAWEDLQRCARDNTPVDALFVTPPEKWGIYGSEWRTFSERSTVVSHAELLMIALAPRYYDAWLERFEQVAPGAMAKFAGNYFENAAITRAAYRTLTTDDLVRIAQRYSAGYIVTEHPHDLALTPGPWACNQANPAYTIYLTP
ncbi:MAG: hypothetical protein JNK29_17175 [Anaerolineales bacterium]|nr:hypothetical protein [Anaerolineales bacterium]